MYSALFAAPRHKKGALLKLNLSELWHHWSQRCRPSDAGGEHALDHGVLPCDLTAPPRTLVRIIGYEWYAGDHNDYLVCLPHITQYSPRPILGTGMF